MRAGSFFLPHKKIMIRTKRVPQDIWGNYKAWTGLSSGDDFWEERVVPVQELRFSQDSVSFEFSDASGNLLDMVTQLLDTADFSSVALAVVVQKGIYYSCNNRRLSALKIYAHLSRAVVRALYRALGHDLSGLRTNQTVKVGGIFFTPHLYVPCAVRRFSQYNCSHDVECHGSPRDNNVLYPEECRDVSIRRINITSYQLSRVLAQMFLSDGLDPTVAEATRRLPWASLAHIRARARAVRRENMKTWSMVASRNRTSERNTGYRA